MKTVEEAVREEIDGKYTLICADCMDVMKGMEKASVDVIFTSPPYNDSAVTENDMKTKRHSKYETVEYRDDWLEWQSVCIKEMMRVAKKYVLYNVQAILANREDVYRLIGRFAGYIHQILIWYKPNAQPQPYPNRIGNSYEMVIIFRGSQFKSLHINSEHYSNVIVQNINANHAYSDRHRAVMSKPFADEIIREFTQKGDLVFDPFMGLATTGVCCAEQGRKFIGTEIHEPYFNLAVARMSETASQASLFDDEDLLRDEQTSLFNEGESGWTKDTP